MRSILGSTLYFVYSVLYTPIHATLLILLAPLMNLRQRYYFAMAWAQLNIYMLRLLCGIEYRIEGAENLPKGGAIVLSKHQSAWETFGIPALLLPRRLCFVYKKELQYVPFFGWAISLLGMVPINRKKGRNAFEQVKEIAEPRLQAGTWMVFFPEGTRVPVGQKKRYKSGGARLAVATQTPVVPVAHNAGEFWGRRMFFKKSGTVVLRFGPPIHPEGHTNESLIQETEHWIEEQMRDISPQHYPK